MRYLALIVSLAAAVSLYSCGGCRCGKTSSDGIRTVDTVRDPFVLEISLNNGSYALLEPVVMTLTVTNVTSRELVLRFNDSQKYDFIVRKDKQVVWRWSEGRAFYMALDEEVIPLKGSISYEVTWDQSGVEAINPPLGAYSVQGILTVDPPVASEDLIFGIVD